ncbi:TraR/DksA family transcriptional regulator [Streptomyces sp. NPDC005820]|uniref:TraR/DksA family transcriptional regulator n=1 Tax=Streptomyces sp. NPDC005820 TaxID=3157069 RepID=UPI0033DE4932
MVAKKTTAEKPKVTAGEPAAQARAARSAGGVKGAAKKAAGETTGEKSPGGKTAAKKTAAPRAAAKKAAASGTAAGKAAGSGTAVRKAGGKKAGGRKAAAGGKAADAGGVAAAGAGKKSTAKKVGAAKAAEQTGATTVVAKKTPGTATAAKNAVPKARLAAVEPGELAVRPGEDPWTPEEVEEARTELQSEMERLRAELASSETALVGLMRDSGDGAGDDQADTGTKNITREHELALAANAREMLIQTEHALERLDAGTYGLCENCGKAIGKARMQAFPRATLCVECKQKQERRY